MGSTQTSSIAFGFTARGLALLVAVTSAALQGCESNHYEIELQPRGERIERKITVWRVRTAAV